MAKRKSGGRDVTATLFYALRDLLTAEGKAWDAAGSGDRRKQRSTLKRLDVAVKKAKAALRLASAP